MSICHFCSPAMDSSTSAFCDLASIVGKCLNSHQIQDWAAFGSKTFSSLAIARDRHEPSNPSIS